MSLKKMLIVIIALGAAFYFGSNWGKTNAIENNVSTAEDFVKNGCSAFANGNNIATEKTYADIIYMPNDAVSYFIKASKADSQYEDLLKSALILLSRNGKNPYYESTESKSLSMNAMLDIGTACLS